MERFRLLSKSSVSPGTILDTTTNKQIEAYDGPALCTLLNEVHAQYIGAVIVANDALALTKRGMYANGDRAFGGDSGTTLAKDLIHNLNVRLKGLE